MHAMSTRALLLIALVVFGAGCSSSRAAEGPPAQRAFYFWRTTLRLSPLERQTLVAQAVSRVYVRAFDLAWDPEAKVASLVGPLEIVDALPPNIEVVPVVFIRQDVFAHMPGAEIAALAERTWSAVQQRIAPLGKIRELQLDCDWTGRSREGYFAFLRAMHATSNVPLSATIRLHQIKYRERTGVPPVARGMLMLYNMGELRAGDDTRAIFDAATTKKYLARLGEYPLALDVALPIWSWTLHTRSGELQELMQSTDPDELASLDFVRAEGDRFLVTRNAFLHGSLLRAGDVLEVERTTPADTRAAAALVRPILHPQTIVMFDLSDRNLRRYHHDQLDSIFRSLR